jgi:hypothetical protein
MAAGLSLQKYLLTIYQCKSAKRQDAERQRGAKRQGGKRQNKCKKAE